MWLFSLEVLGIAISYWIIDVIAIPRTSNENTVPTTRSLCFVIWNTTKLENFSDRYGFFENRNRNDLAVGTVVTYLSCNVTRCCVLGSNPGITTGTNEQYFESISVINKCVTIYRPWCCYNSLHAKSVLTEQNYLYILHYVDLLPRLSNSFCLQ